MDKRNLIHVIAAEFARYENAMRAVENGNDYHERNVDDSVRRLSDIERNLLPSGSGIDCGHSNEKIESAYGEEESE